MVAGQEINFPGWVGGGGGIGNKAQLRPARLELGLGLSLAKRELNKSGGVSTFKKCPNYK